MKKINRKGFTLIELLAVIVIMGILMLVAIPAVQRYMKDSRAKTFANSANELMNAVKTAYMADELSCSGSGDSDYYISIEDANKLMDTKMKSSYKASSALTGGIKISVSGGKATYSIAVTDAENNGFNDYTESSDLNGNSVQHSSAAPAVTSTCTVNTD